MCTLANGHMAARFARFGLLKNHTYESMSLCATLTTTVIGATVVGRVLLCLLNYESMFLDVGRATDEKIYLGSGTDFDSFT